MEEVVYYRAFDVTEGSVIFVHPDGEFGLIKVVTPNGTSSPDERVYYADLALGYAPESALEAGATPLNERLYFSTRPVSRPLKLGDKLLFRELRLTDNPSHLSRLATWCYTEDWLALRHAMDQYRFLAPNQAPTSFHNILDLMNLLDQGLITIPKGVMWQRRPSLGPGRHYSVQGTEVNVGWQRCSDPRRQLVS